jgi:uncharacterized protein
MYHHADQSWRNQPTFLSDSHRKKLAERIGEYATRQNLNELLVIFHGGEPLLAGGVRIVETAQWIKDALPSSTIVDFSLQTNGVLLSEDTLKILEDASIGVSLSIDGPKEVNDLHRVDHKGESSFDSTRDALQRLTRHPTIFAGIISVIDPTVPPKTYFEFFDEYNPPQLDFLLPDANHLSPPLYRNSNPDIYKSWLLEAFDLWFDEYAHIPVRSFDGLLNSLSGLSSGTDALGLGDVSLLTIETDGTYHDLDVLKITREGGTQIRIGGVDDAAIIDAVASEQIANHRRMLSLEGLSSQCQSCPVVDICGGGAVPHRYSENGFSNPTIYCLEMLSLIQHVRNRLIEQLQNELKSLQSDLPVELKNIDLTSFENPDTSLEILQEFLTRWSNSAYPKFFQALDLAVENNSNLAKWVSEIQTLPKKQLQQKSHTKILCRLPG